MESGGSVGSGQIGGVRNIVMGQMEESSRDLHVPGGVEMPVESGPTVGIVYRDIPPDEEMHFVVRKLF